MPQPEAAEPQQRQPVPGADPEDGAQVELLTWLAEKGCVCCTEQLASQQRFFFLVCNRELRRRSHRGSGPSGARLLPAPHPPAGEASRACRP